MSVLDLSREFDPLERILDELYVVNTKLTLLQNYVSTQFQALDLKKAKRNRTGKNKCTFISDKRNGKKCSGYVYAKSQSLCYAHHLLAINPETNGVLFKKNKKNREELSPAETLVVMQSGIELEIPLLVITPTLMSGVAEDDEDPCHSDSSDSSQEALPSSLQEDQDDSPTRD